MGDVYFLGHKQLKESNCTRENLTVSWATTQTSALELPALHTYAPEVQNGSSS